MLAIERRNAILAKLHAEGKVIVADLSRKFDVTEETIRRDLEKLDREGLAKKTYGGAVCLQISMGAGIQKTVQGRGVSGKDGIACVVITLAHTVEND